VAARPAPSHATLLFLRIDSPTHLSIASEPFRDVTVGQWGPPMRCLARRLQAVTGQNKRTCRQVVILSCSPS